MTRTMGRPRKQGNRDLPDGLYPPAGKGCYRMIHPVTHKPKSLKTKNKAEALEIYWAVRQHYAPNVETKAQVFTEGLSLSSLAREYREDQLPQTVDKDGNSLDANTLRTYSNYLLNFEQADDFKVPVSVFGHVDDGPQIVRKYLSHWINKPKTYNYRLACLSRLFGYAVDKGMIQRSPIDAIKYRKGPTRKVYLSDDHYIAITSKLTEIYSEVYARACDWLYLMSGRPTNMLDVKEPQIKDKDAEIHYYADKNQQPVIVERDPELDELIEWFREYKRSQGIVSPYLIVHPANARRGLARRPITTERLYRYFKNAMDEAELSEEGYTLRDLRPKALTDEAELAGSATNKGAHKTEKMRRHYVKKVLPMRVKNNLKRLKAG